MQFEMTWRRYRNTLQLVVTLLSLFGRITSHSALADRPAFERQAISLFQQSSKAYSAGRFEEAAALLLQAYQLRQDPVLLFNLARAYESAGSLTLAVSAYEKYLIEAPQASDRGAVEQRLVTLRKTLVDRATLEEERDVERRNAEAERRRTELVLKQTPQNFIPPPTKPTHPTLAPWVILGSGAALIATGLTFGVLSRRQFDLSLAEPFLAPSKLAYSAAADFAQAANVMYVLGASLSLTGLIWVIARIAFPTSQKGATVLVTPNGFGVASAF